MTILTYKEIKKYYFSKLRLLIKIYASQYASVDAFHKKMEQFIDNDILLPIISYEEWNRLLDNYCALGKIPYFKMENMLRKNIYEN